MFTFTLPQRFARPFQAINSFALVLAVTSLALTTSLTAAEAVKETTMKAFSIPSGPAETTLRTFSDQSGRSVMFAPEKVKGVTTNEVKGDLAVSDALERLLLATKLSAVAEPRTGGFAIRRQQNMGEPEKNAVSRSSSDRTADGYDDKKLELPVFEVMGSKLLNMDIKRPMDDLQPYVV